MKLFAPKDPPNTISDDDYADLRDRAEREQRRRGGMFSTKAVEQRKAGNKQRDRRNAS